MCLQRAWVDGFAEFNAAMIRRQELAGKAMRAAAPLNWDAQRLHEAMLDRDAVAARDDALLVIGIDAGVDEERPLP